MTEKVECIVVGAGVVGLAIARKLALAGREVLIAEAAETFGTGTSSRNSEVIHAGIYYVPGSLKGRLCLPGKFQLYDYCAERGIRHQRLGKFIVACSAAEIATLHELKARAFANGCDDVYLIDGAEARRQEPELVCHAALVSPSTGIVDSHGLMLSFLGDAEAMGATLAIHSPVTGVRHLDPGFEVSVGPDQDYRLRCDILINSAGLGSLDLARNLAGMPRACIPPGHMLKGNYFTLAGKSPFSRLIYPVPVPGGSGTHITIDLGGQARFGPDVEAVDRIEYSVDPRRGDSFYADIRRYWPGIRDGSLQPAYSGIRPRLGQIGEAWDFVIQGKADHGIAGLVHLFGIESPGLTSSLAIADHVAGLI
ncbi:MAG: NAD(P)/FAD-dependent oxidoreductase [Alphaproteobacteria bacterium]|nr:NAD(P)/FAD-dependent oxidoreductase [Alphaproteobacteria bacterium]